MDIFIYFSQLSVPRDVVEDALQDCLGDRGEVTGGGLGNRGANIDIEVFSDQDGPLILCEMKRTLRGMDVPQDTWLVIEGERHDLYN